MEDIERPLNSRGKNDAPVMARRLLAHGFVPQLLLCSPAKRTRKTAGVFAETLGYPKKKIIFADDIYYGALAELLALIRALDDAADRVLLVGHNPYLTILAEELSGERFGNIPTCGLVILDFPLSSWREAERGEGRLLHYDYPKKGGADAGTAASEPPR